MSSQPTPDNRRRRRKLYSQLTQLLAKLTPRSPESFSQENLQSLGIQCSAMTLLPEEDPNAGPLYCELVAPRVMDEAFDNYWAEQDADDGPPQWPRPPKYTNIFYNAYAVAGTIGDYIASLSYVYDTEWCETGSVVAFAFAALRLTPHLGRETSPALTFHRNQYPGTYRQWGVCGILRVESSKQPHLACMHVDDAPPEEGLRPSELLSAIKLMKQAVKLDKHDRFPIYPVRSHLSTLFLRPTSLVILIRLFSFTDLCILFLRPQSSHFGNLLRIWHTLRTQDPLC